VDLASAIVLLGGPALYLIGNVFFKRASAKHYPLSHLAGLGALTLVAPFSLLFTPLALGALTTGVLIVVAIWETRSFSRGPRVP
jgi:low temperature requirement protein LtrA